MVNTIKRALRRRGLQAGVLAVTAAISSVGFLPRDTYVQSATRNVATWSAQPDVPTTTVPESATAGSSTATASAATGLPDLEHPRVESWIKRWTTSQRGSFATYLSRMTKYEDMIESKLDERGMPRGLIYVAMIESGFNPKAKSPVKASGLWQFMGATGREYGLVVNGSVDERNNPARSTDAALKYLDRLYDRFGSWYLAAAAYNTGQGRVAKVLKQVTGKTRGTDEDFYRISHRLPQETRDYVPKLVAAARIGSNPEQYGFRD
ncbi:MAG: lytic transglycosylase domain-containing protein [Gemmatimonadaceae bacterium]